MASSLLGHPMRAALAAFQGLALLHVGLTYGVGVGTGWGPSMLPTFAVMQEWFVTDKRCRRGRGVAVGDCVLYTIPVEPAEEGVKRVLGMPGDYVLLNSPGDGPACRNMIQVPKGHVYIVGDNLPWSRDSRDFGPLPMALIKGKIIAKISAEGFWPWEWNVSRVESGLQPVADPDAPRGSRT
ncbi:LexA/Signal peptidase [Xylariomycetidae sp. FL0641]|nr:LexA/Signal peptidase [Xylariomycetidae sp. FL0641]